MRKEFGLHDSALVFGIVGRLTPSKDHATFLKASKLILQKLPEARFLVVGDGPLRRGLESRASELGLRNALIFTGLRNDMPAVLAALDVMVFSSLWEGLPVALLEGMAAARPVVATTVGGIPGVVLPDKTAFLIPPGDAVALPEACLRFSFDPGLRQRMGQAGLERAAAHYSMDVMVNRTAALYARLLQERGLGRLIPPLIEPGTIDKIEKYIEGSYKPHNRIKRTGLPKEVEESEIEWQNLKTRCEEVNIIILEKNDHVVIRQGKRKINSVHEKIRVGVTKNIENALDVIKKVHVELYKYLKERITTGSTCSFREDPEKKWRIEW